MDYHPTHIVPDQPTTTPAASKAKHPSPLKRITILTIVVCTISFATISILAIWGVFKDNSADFVGKWLGTFAIIAFVALVVNLSEDILSPKKK